LTIEKRECIEDYASFKFEKDI